MLGVAELLQHEHARDSLADAKTMTASCTSSGLRFSVSFSAVAPPAASSFHDDWVGGDDIGCPPASDNDEYSHSSSSNEYSGSDDDSYSYLKEIVE
jgi:hypothetical protein